MQELFHLWLHFGKIGYKQSLLRFSLLTEDVMKTAVVQAKCQAHV